MKNADIKAFSVDEIREKLKLEEDNLQKLKFAHAISPVENPMRIRVTRKLVARLKTELSTKEKAN
jgi:large subunit ribosomal protein L29